MSALGARPGRMSYALVRDRHPGRHQIYSVVSFAQHGAQPSFPYRTRRKPSQGAHHLIKTEQWEPAVSWLEEAAEAGHTELLQPRHAKVRRPPREAPSHFCWRWLVVLTVRSPHSISP